MRARGSSLYVPGDSWLHRLDPLTKLGLALAAVALVFVLPAPPASLGLWLLLAAVLGSAGLLRALLPVLAGAGFLAVTFFVVQGLVYPGNLHPVLRAGPLVLYREGLLLGLLLALRLFDILTATALLVMATRPSDLVEALVRRGLSPRLGYVIVAVLQVIPAMVATASTILDAQRSRGMETEGSLAVRLRALLPLVTPLVTGSLLAAHERALALEVRGFSARGPRTFLREEAVGRGALLLRGLAALFLLLALLLRVAGGVGRWP
ncbi:MAG: energy-coupling factor transporter transmembrane component T [Bacillota bacterium]|nr:energy-coupling factor transporter transmembrane component T [Bacillota bacterium]MDI3318127.1 energy-coupling factor transporter transmembrane component T [Bacillota bacterium]